MVEPSVSLVEHMEDGRLDGIVLKDRRSTYRDGTRVGWSNVKDRSWYDREVWRGSTERENPRRISCLGTFGRLPTRRTTRCSGVWKRCCHWSSA